VLQTSQYIELGASRQNVETIKLKLQKKLTEELGPVFGSVN